MIYIFSKINKKCLEKNFLRERLLHIYAITLNPTEPPVGYNSLGQSPERYSFFINIGRLYFNKEALTFHFTGKDKKRSTLWFSLGSCENCIKTMLGL